MAEAVEGLALPTSIRDPRWMRADQSVLDVTVTFAALAGEHGFTAIDGSGEAHVQDIWDRAHVGEFGPIAAYVVPPPIVPDQVPAAAARIVLRRHGLLAPVKAAVAASGEDSELSIWFEFSTVWERANPYVAQLAAEMTPPLAPATVDALFLEAGTVQAA